MNKSQKFDVMMMRAKIQVDEMMKQHDNLMNGKEAVLISDINKDDTPEELFESLEE